MGQFVLFFTFYFNNLQVSVFQFMKNDFETSYV